MADEPEMDGGAGSAAETTTVTPGAKLRGAREVLGLSLQEVAIRTRIAQRQLEAIETDDYTALPGIPYAIGFARAYARAVGLDEVAIAADVRRAVHASDLGANRYETFEPTDPARVPSRTLAWVTMLILLLLVGGYAIWRTQLFTPPTTEQLAERATPAATSAPVRPRAPAAPPVVVFTAVEDVWLRIYDEAGERLRDGLMKTGESFTLPAQARNPMILTGRPQALRVTVGGREVPPLGPADRTISDVPVSGAALLARPAPQAPAAGASAPAPGAVAAPPGTAPAPAQSAPPSTR
ncbi:MAG: RodZ domain-containing protein [Sphingobium sp.]